MTIVGSNEICSLEELLDEFCALTLDSYLYTLAYPQKQVFCTPLAKRESPFAYRFASEIACLQQEELQHAFEVPCTIPELRYPSFICYLPNKYFSSLTLKSGMLLVLSFEIRSDFKTYLVQYSRTNAINNDNQFWLNDLSLALHRLVDRTSSPCASECLMYTLGVGDPKENMDRSYSYRCDTQTRVYQLCPSDNRQRLARSVAIPMVNPIIDLQLPLLAHCNGDAAIDMLLKGYELARRGDYSRPWNVTTIHTQFLRSDQIPQFVKYKIRPSFYTLHTFYFADAHLANRGQQQAMNISPMREAIDAGLRPTNHTDFVVAPLDRSSSIQLVSTSTAQASLELSKDSHKCS